MTEVKPWEPVSAGYFEEGQWPILARNPRRSFYGFYPHYVTPVHMVLANGQKVKVTPLSEDRKAAQAMQKRVNKAVEANR